MTRRASRVAALEDARGGRDAVQEAARRAYLHGLTDAELHALHVELLRAEGHPDPEGEAARVGAYLRGLTTDELHALAGQPPGGPETVGEGEVPEVGGAF